MSTTQEKDEYVASLPMVLDEVEVRTVERVSPSYVRIELGGAAVAEIGVDGDLLDQRIKLILPNAAGALPSFAGMEESWWDTWLRIPEDDRGAIRTYTIRDLVGTGAERRMVVDIVVHEPGEHSGPGNDWALAARPGDRVITLAPRRGHAFGGIEWAPGTASRLLLVGDETAVPAIRGIVRDLPADAVGAVFLEVPVGDDAFDVSAEVPVPAGVTFTWLPRDGRPRGEALHATVVAHLTGEAARAAAPVVDDDEIDPDLWETPVYSSSGEEVSVATAVPPSGSACAGLYAWIAGESKVVTGLRRRLVNDLGLERSQVAFMGYWREGVAMRS
jgi:NADPH-dependent ferric siderophore reductase